MTARSIPIDGITYHTLLSGPPSTPVILLTHALMSSSHMWDSTTSCLHAANYRTLTFDHIGHNLTPPPQNSSRSYSTEDITHHMHEIVAKATGQSKLKAVIGCSIGGVLALRYAMLFPDDVEAVISLCAPGMSSIEAAKPLWTQRIKQFERDVRDGTQKLHRETVDRWLPGDEPWDAEVRARAFGHVTTCSLAGYKILADAIRGYDYDGELEGMRGVKVLIIAGGRDRAVRQDLLEGLAKRIQGARFECLEDAGHIPPMDRPEAFESVILEALA